VTRHAYFTISLRRCEIGRHPSFARRHPSPERVPPDEVSNTIAASRSRRANHFIVQHQPCSASQFDRASASIHTAAVFTLCRIATLHESHLTLPLLFAPPVCHSHEPSPGPTPSSASLFFDSPGRSYGHACVEPTRLLSGKAASSSVPMETGKVSSVESGTSACAAATKSRRSGNAVDRRQGNRTPPFTSREPFPIKQQHASTFPCGRRIVPRAVQPQRSVTLQTCSARDDKFPSLFFAPALRRASSSHQRTRFRRSISKELVGRFDPHHFFSVSSFFFPPLVHSAFRSFVPSTAVSSFLRPSSPLPVLLFKLLPPPVPLLCFLLSATSITGPI